MRLKGRERDQLAGSRWLGVVLSMNWPCLSLLREALQLSTATRKVFCLLVLPLALFSLVPPSFGAPVELLVNGNFKNGLEGWMIEGTTFLDGESIRIVREGSLSQIVQRPDLSFHLELSYSVRTELVSKVYFARSLVTFYVIDREKNSRFTIIGDVHVELGNSGWRDVRLKLYELFRRDVGNSESFRLVALRISMELGFTTSVPPPSAACFRSISLKRVNPVRILLTKGECTQLPDRTELVVLVTNVGDVDASNLVVALIPTSEVVVISESAIFRRPLLDGGASWRLSWMLIARTSGTHAIAIRAGSDQAEAELSLSVSIQGIPQITTTQTSTITVERVDEQVVVLFVQTAFLVMVAFLIVVVILPIMRGRGGTEVVYRLRLLRNQSTSTAIDRVIQLSLSKLWHGL